WNGWWSVLSQHRHEKIVPVFMELETHHGPRRMMLSHHKKSSPPKAASPKYNARWNFSIGMQRPSLRPAHTATRIHGSARKYSLATAVVQKPDSACPVQMSMAAGRKKR